VNKAWNCQRRTGCYSFYSSSHSK